MKTRERILHTAKQLFNQHGYGNVTIAILASELGITKGNLWYHFNDKQSLLEALGQEFIELDGARRTIRPERGQVLAGYVTFLRALAGEIREFRFLFRDHSDYGEHTESVLNHLPIIYAESQTQFEEFFGLMKQEGFLTIDSIAIPALAINVILVLRCNLEFLRECQQVAVDGSGAVQVTLKQHLTLFSDKLSLKALEFFENELGIESAPRAVLAG